MLRGVDAQLPFQADLRSGFPVLRPAFHPFVIGLVPYTYQRVNVGIGINIIVPGVVEKYAKARNWARVKADGE